MRINVQGQSDEKVAVGSFGSEKISEVVSGVGRKWWWWWRVGAGAGKCVVFECYEGALYIAADADVLCNVGLGVRWVMMTKTSGNMFQRRRLTREKASGGS